jgi:alcohol dehydrogenase class IV
MQYDFVSPGRIVFGWGRRVEVGRLGQALGRRALIVSGSRTLEQQGTLGEIEESLAAAGISALHVASISREPEVADVDAAAAKVRMVGPGLGDFVLAIGGGSAIDLAKAVAALATHRHGESVRDFLEGVGRGLQITQPPLPILALPTTAGSGSEATKNAVISSYDPPLKKSLRADALLPRLVLIDPQLTVSLSPATTIHTGLDACTQLIESYISCRARPIPQALALSGLELAAGAIEAALADPYDRRAREALAHAALLSGMALANSGLGMAHGVAAALGVHCRVQHGLACAVMLPAALRANRNVRETELARLAEVMSGRSFRTTAAAADACLDFVEELCERLGIPRRLSALGVQREQLPALVRDSYGNSMSGNPRQISPAELQVVLESMW